MCSFVFYLESSKKVNIYSVDILRIWFVCRDFIKNSVVLFDKFDGIKDLIGTALICFLRSASVLALQGVWPVSIS